MKNTINIVVYFFVLFFSLFSGYSQNSGNTAKGIIKEKSWSLEALGGLGFAQMYSEDYHNINANSSFSEILIGYSLNRDLRLKTGFQQIKLNKSSIQSGNYTNLESSSIQVPLKLGFVVPSSFLDGAKMQYVLDIGVYGNYHLKNKLVTNSSKDEEKYLGWHLGYCLDVGMEFKLSDFISGGIYLDNYVSKNMNKKDIKFRIDDSRLLKLAIIFIMR